MSRRALPRAIAAAARYLGAHTHLFTYGENLGQPDCAIPLVGMSTGGRRGRRCCSISGMPAAVSAGPFFTSVATWENKGKDITIAGETYRWSKHVNFLRFLDLPRQTLQPCRLAMWPPTRGGRGAGARGRLGHRRSRAGLGRHAALSRFHRELARPSSPSPRTSMSGRRTGWFSDRSVCYLAAGRPVVTQDTGFSKTIRSDAGLFAFTTIEEIREAIGRINADYRRQCHRRPRGRARVLRRRSGAPRFAAQGGDLRGSAS